MKPCKQYSCEGFFVIFFNIDFVSLVLKISPQRHVPVCSSAFVKAHLRSHSYYDDMVKSLKAGGVNGDKSFFKNHCPITSTTVKQLMENGGEFGLKLSPAEFSRINLKKTLISIYTCRWMKDYFHVMGKLLFSLLS